MTEEKKRPESTTQAILKWQKNNLKQLKLNLHITNDADILEKLDSVPSKLGYIKELIRKDIAESKKPE